MPRLACLGDMHAFVRHVSGRAASCRSRLARSCGSTPGGGAPRCCRAARALPAAASASPRLMSSAHMRPFQCARLNGSIQGLWPHDLEFRIRDYGSGLRGTEP